MNIVLWVLQVLLAFAFAAHGWMLVAPPADLVEIMNESLGVEFRIFIGVAELLGAAGLILPALTRILPWLTPLAAAALAVVVGSATVLHLSRGETSSAITTLILCVLSLFVAYKRMRSNAISPRHATVAS